MELGSEYYRSVKLTDNINTASLSLADQFRLLFAKLSNDEVAELDTNEKLNAARLRKVAALSKFIDKATDRLNELGEDSVTVSLSSEFLPFIDEVIDPVRGKGRFYTFEVRKRNIPMDVKHTFIVVIRKKFE